MADDRPTYRPRRAAAGDGPTPDPSDTEQVTSPQAGHFREDEARPIYREDAADADAATVRTPGAQPGRPAPAAAPTAASDATDAGADAGADVDADGGDVPDPGSDAAPGRTSRLNFTPRARPDDDESTTLLPRTAAGAGAAGGAGTGDGDGAGSGADDLDDGPHRFGRRTRLALLIGAVAAVVVVGLAIMYTVVGVRATPDATSSAPPTAASSAAGTPSATALLDDASMLAPEGAAAIAGRRTWTAGTTVRGPVPDGSGPGCLGSDPVEGAPTAQQTITRTLTASGSSAPTALHVAQAYASAEDATQAFASTTKALGTCAVTGDWLTNGRAVSGVGDQAVGAAVRSVADGKAVLHWVVVSRTGRVLDVVDAGTPSKKALNVDDVARSLASVVTTQCGPAGGTCPTTVSTKDAPPPAGGDEPGFLTAGDLPPVGSTTAPWVGTPVEPPTEDFTGSQCESVNWSTTAATDKSSRVYLLQDVPGIFGLNEIVLTAKDAGSAAKLVDKVRGDWTSCKERKLTASVDSPTEVTGVADDGSHVVGYTTLVEQKAGSTTTRFRVGIASSGDKVAFVFLNPQKGLDVDGDDWNVVAVRAVQRATQQS